MYRSFIALLAILVLSMFSSAGSRYQANRFEWKDWNVAYPEAVENQKILLVDIYTDWCGWCKKMDRDTYAKPRIQNKIAGDFIAVKFNPEKSRKYLVNGKSFNGKELLSMLVQGKRIGYPTTVFLVPQDGKFKPVQVSGYQGPDQFEKTLNQVMAMQ